MERRFFGKIKAPLLMGAALLFFIPALSADIPQPQVSATDAQSAFDQAMRLRDENRFEEAEDLLRTALELEPDNSMYHYELGNIYAYLFESAANLGDDAQASAMLSLAAREYEQAVMISPDSVEARFNLGVIYKKQHNYAKAREVFKEIVRRNPGDFQSLMQIGQTYEEEGFFDEARDAYEAARQFNATNYEAADALDGLDQRQAYEHERTQSQLGSQLGAVSSYLSNPQASNYTGGYGTQQQGSPMQALPYLSNWLLSKLSKNNQDDSYSR